MKCCHRALAEKLWITITGYDREETWMALYYILHSSLIWCMWKFPLMKSTSYPQATAWKPSIKKKQEYAMKKFFPRNSWKLLDTKKKALFVTYSSPRSLFEGPPTWHPGWSKGSHRRNVLPFSSNHNPILIPWSDSGKSLRWVRQTVKTKQSKDQEIASTIHGAEPFVLLASFRLRLCLHWSWSDSRLCALLSFPSGLTIIKSSPRSSLF